MQVCQSIYQANLASTSRQDYQILVGGALGWADCWVGWGVGQGAELGLEGLSDPLWGHSQLMLWLSWAVPIKLFKIN
jgi:hypothetical protein